MSAPKNSAKDPVIFLLMAGGAGRRLWPASRLERPKPLYRPDGRRSLIERAIKLLAFCEDSPEITVLAGASQERILRSHIGAIETPGTRIGFSSEPLSRNTAPAIALGVMRTLRELEPDADPVFAVCPSDHFIGERDSFRSALTAAAAAAQKGFITAMGAAPTRPETGYGYIRKGAEIKTASGLGVFKIKDFIEKPDAETARKYAAQSFLWNCGIFVFKGRVMLDEIKKYAPEVFSVVRRSLAREDASGAAEARSYGRCPDISIDCAVMEKTKLGAVVEADFQWSDIGSWDAVYDLAKKDARGNAASGDVFLEDSQRCLIRSDGGRLIVAAGLKDLVVVDEPDALLISGMGDSAKVKSAAGGLVRRKRPQAAAPARSERRWGFEETAEEGSGFSVKRICVLEKMEYQPPPVAGRIIILEGEAAAVLGAKGVGLSAGDLLEVPAEIPARVKNRGKSPLRLLHIRFEPKG